MQHFVVTHSVHMQQENLLQAAGWPDAGGTVLVVGHQPILGDVAQRLLGMQMSCSVKKGAVWWLQKRVREDQEQVVLKAVQNPRML